MGEKILIIEDELIVATTIKNLLDKQGYDVCGIAMNYHEGQQLFTQCSPDLVLCDIKIKGEKSGVELIADLKKFYQFFLIYLTAYGDEAYLKMANETKPDAFLIKPYTDHQLLTSVQFILQRMDDENTRLPASDLLKHLSKRELEIVQFALSGKSRTEIANHLNRSIYTIDTHFKNIIRKTGVSSTTQLIVELLKKKQ